MGRTILPYDGLNTDEALRSIQQGKPSIGGGCEPPRSRAARRSPGALTLQYSSMGFSLFTATSRTWLLRNRILPEEGTDERGGLGASPAMQDSATALSRKVSRRGFIPGSSHGCRQCRWLRSATLLCPQRRSPSTGEVHTAAALCDCSPPSLEDRQDGTLRGGVSSRSTPALGANSTETRCGAGSGGMRRNSYYRRMHGTFRSWMLLVLSLHRRCSTQPTTTTGTAAL